MKSKTTSHGAPTHSGAGRNQTSDTSVTAREHFRREKSRRSQQALAETPAMAAARREYLALLEADAAKGRGGRPKKKRATPQDADQTDEVAGDSADE